MASSRYIKDGEDYDIPNKFLCPLTLEVMIYPVMDRYGRSYERSAIVEWITTQTATCPITREPLHVKNLYPNNKLRTEIVLWREEHGDKVNIDLSLEEDNIVEQEFTRAIQVWSEELNVEFATANRESSSHPRRHRCLGNVSSRMKRLFKSSVNDDFY